MSTEALLDERSTTHGSFADNAKNGQAIRAIFRKSANWDTMPAVHREALDHIAGKLSRILSGQSRHDDHWKDIAGYATLALEACHYESYGHRQMHQLRTCTGCGKDYYMPGPVCVVCRSNASE